MCGGQRTVCQGFLPPCEPRDWNLVFSLGGSPAGISESLGNRAGQPCTDASWPLSSLTWLHRVPSLTAVGTRNRPGPLKPLKSLGLPLPLLPPRQPWEDELEESGYLQGPMLPMGRHFLWSFRFPDQPCKVAVVGVTGQKWR